MNFYYYMKIENIEQIPPLIKTNKILFKEANKKKNK